VILPIAALLSFSLISDPSCPTSEMHRFDFLVGNWHGREYNFMNGSKDSTPGDLIAARNHKLPYGCAFEEHWEFTSNDTVASSQWKYSLVDKWIELATFTSAPSDGGWVFAYDIPGPNPRRLHIRWIPTPAGYTEVIQVSPDSGRTWPIVRHLNYTRDRVRPT
jgi:hypothetical protein